MCPSCSPPFQAGQFTQHDLYVTEYNPCEQFAGSNPGNCPAGNGKTVDTWVNGRTLTHPVVWMNVGFHHVARDEDQQPTPIHWQGFAIPPATSRL